MPNFMQGGMFGPSGGPQGMGGLTERELLMLANSGQQGGQMSGEMPNYAPAGGPPPPQTISGSGQGIDPSMMNVGMQGGVQGMDMTGQGAGGAGAGMSGLSDQANQLMMQKYLEDQRMQQMGSMMPMGGGPVPGGGADLQFGGNNSGKYY